jgi:hypothetical protein
MSDFFAVLNSVVLYLSFVLLFVSLLLYTTTRMVRRIGVQRVAGRRILTAMIMLGLLLVVATGLSLAFPSILVANPWITAMTASGLIILLTLAFFVAGRRL